MFGSLHVNCYLAAVDLLIHGAKRSICSVQGSQVHRRQFLYLLCSVLPGLASGGCFHVQYYSNLYGAMCHGAEEPWRIRQDPQSSYTCSEVQGTSHDGPQPHHGFQEQDLSHYVYSCVRDVPTRSWLALMGRRGHMQTGFRLAWAPQH